MFSVLTAKPSYIAVGAVYVEKESLLATLTSLQDSGLAWVTPAQATVDEFKELIQTDAFIRAIISQTDIESEMNQGDTKVSEIIGDTRASIWAVPLGNNLIQVGATHEKGPIAEQLAKALVESYLQWKIKSDQQDSTSAQVFFDDLVKTYRADLQKAQNDQQAFLEEHPDPVRGERTLLEEVQINDLQRMVSEANTRLTNAIEKLDSAKLALSQSDSKARQTYQLIDTPHVPPGTGTSKTKMAMNAVIMAVVGLILGVVAAAGAAFLDSSFRFPIDVENTLSLPVLAIVPDAGGQGKAARGKRAGKAREVTK